MSTLTVKELAAPTGFDLKIASGETLDLKSQGTVTMPEGSVLQVVTVHDTTVVAGTTTITSAGVTITPSSTASKIFISFSIALETSGSTTDRGVHTKIFRGATQIMYQPYQLYASSDISQRIGKETYTLLDSPNTTSAITYTFTAIATTGTARMNNYESCKVTLMEIQG